MQYTDWAIHNTVKRNVVITQHAMGGAIEGDVCAGKEQVIVVLIQNMGVFAAYPLQVIQAELFDIDQSSANEWIHRLLPVLNDSVWHIRHNRSWHFCNFVNDVLSEIDQYQITCSCFEDAVKLQTRDIPAHPVISLH